MLFYFKFILIWFLFHLGIFRFHSALLISGALFYKDLSLHRKNCINKQQVLTNLLKFCLFTFTFTLGTSNRSQSLWWSFVLSLLILLYEQAAGANLFAEVLSCHFYFYFRNKQEVPITLLKFCLITFNFTLWTSCRCQSVCWKDSCFITFTLCPLLHFYHGAHLASLMIMMMIIVIVIVSIIIIIIIILTRPWPAFGRRA